MSKHTVICDYSTTIVSECNYKSKTKEGAISHIKFNHSGLDSREMIIEEKKKGEKLYECPHCEYRSYWKHYLTTHIKREHKHVVLKRIVRNNKGEFVFAK
uniref:C2H2-type domain-containing protein n=1 Tax=Cacopsylla melanoneura TaxID=428564 RepID=A0A8D8VQL5_9HEMI